MEQKRKELSRLARKFENVGKFLEELKKFANQNPTDQQILDKAKELFKPSSPSPIETACEDFQTVLDEIFSEPRLSGCSGGSTRIRG